MEAKIKFKGWTDGFDKVALNILLRQYAGLGLKQAKDVTDAILDNEQIEVTSNSLEGANLLREGAQKIGAVCV